MVLFSTVCPMWVSCNIELKETILWWDHTNHYTQSVCTLQWTWPEKIRPGTLTRENRGTAPGLFRMPSHHHMVNFWSTFAINIHICFSSNAHKHDTAHPFHKLASLLYCFQRNTHWLWSYHNMVWVDGNDWNWDTMIQDLNWMWWREESWGGICKVLWHVILTCSLTLAKSAQECRMKPKAGNKLAFFNF